MKKLANYSVLMTTYHKENPIFLKEAIESVLNQTHPTDDFILVVDGEVGAKLQEVISFYESNPIVTVIYLPVNKGLGYAVNFGLKHAKNELVGRADSDDICFPERFEKQVIFLKENSSISAVSSAVEELYEDGHIKIKTLPTTPKEVEKYMIWRNPVNHPAVIFRKSDVEKVGGYIPLYRHEDYYLYAKLIVSGYKIANLDECTVRMRMTSDSFKRRGGFQLYKSTVAISKLLYQNKYIPFWKYVYRNSINFIYKVILPSNIKQQITEKILRKNCI